MQKAVGETITLVRTNPATGAETRERARVLAANGGVVLQIGERIEVLRDDGLPVRVIFDRVPENLRARPTLSVTVESERGGRRPVTLTYLTPGLAWQADYVALFDEAGGRMDVQGWITLTNNSGTPYRQRRHPAGRRRGRPGSAAGLSLRSAAAAAGDSCARPAPRARTASGSAISISIRCPSGRRSPTARPSRSASSTSTARRRARAYEYRNGWLGTPDRAAERQHRAALLELARPGPRRRAAGRDGPRLSARRARQSAIRRREPDRPHADGLRARPHHRPGVRRQGAAGGRSRERITESQWRRPPATASSPATAPPPPSPATTCASASIGRPGCATR